MSRKLSGSDQAAEAERVAREAHSGQLDKANRPYVEHLGRVARKAPDDGERAVAWLHDSIEDTTITRDWLSQAGFSDQVIEDIEQLTRKPHERYGGYIERLRMEGSDRAVRVKLADLADHLESNSGTIGRSLRHRYVHATKRLTKSRNSQ